MTQEDYISKLIILEQALRSDNPTVKDSLEKLLLITKVDMADKPFTDSYIIELLHKESIRQVELQKLNDRVNSITTDTPWFGSTPNRYKL